MTSLNLHSGKDLGTRKVALIIEVDTIEANALAGWLEEWGWEEHAERLRQELEDMDHEEQIAKRMRLRGHRV